MTSQMHECNEIVFHHFSYLSWTPPQYFHLPLLLNTDGSKLSKRKSGEAVTVEYFNRSVLLDIFKVKNM